MRFILCLLLFVLNAAAIQIDRDSVYLDSTHYQTISPFPDSNTAAAFRLINNSSKEITIDTMIASEDSIPVWMLTDFSRNYLTVFYTIPEGYMSDPAKITIAPFETLAVLQLDATSWPRYIPADCIFCRWEFVPVNFSISFIANTGDTARLQVAGYAYMAKPFTKTRIAQTPAQHPSKQNYTLKRALLNGQIIPLAQKHSNTSSDIALPVHTAKQNYSTRIIELFK